MERVRALARHVAAQPAVAQGAPDGAEAKSALELAKQAFEPKASGQEGKASGGADKVPKARQRRPTQEELQEIFRVMREYTESNIRLKEEGVVPAMTTFDLLMATNHVSWVYPRKELSSMLDAAEKEGRLAAAEALPGPWRQDQSRGEQVELLRKVGLSEAQGWNVQLFALWQQQLGGRGLSSNIAVPLVVTHGAGDTTRIEVSTRVIVGDPADAERLARTHVRKEPFFEAAVFDSIISTTDNEYWRRQRSHLAEAFMPLSSLARVLPVSLARAKECAARLASLAAGGSHVDMSDFLLHEAQAQLQLALLGVPEEVMDATNERLRGAFMGNPDEGQVGALGKAMRLLMEQAKADKGLALPSDGPDVRGPVLRAIQSSDFGPTTDYGNILLVLFAGHDTTGHTMTWLLFELARQPEVQRELRREVDAFFASLGGRDPGYTDLGGLDLMDRCITETLRLWPAVANGTYRQLHFDDVVTGPDGAPVRLPKGTLVNIVNWSRHRNPELWGPDADKWDPQRDFQEGEIARVARQLAGCNPQSARFSPFSHRPRSCLGRNFAQMEMRLIISYLIRSFDFSLAPPYDALAGGMPLGATLGAGEGEADGFRAVNRITLGPMDLERSGECVWGRRHQVALKMIATPRSSARAPERLSA